MGIFDFSDMILYKYLPPTRIDVLEQLALRFTQPLAFNDPFDSHPYVDTPGLGQVWAGLSPEEKEKVGDEDTFRRVASFVTGKINAAIEQQWYRSWSSKVGILCLSEVNDSLLMWSHYTDAYRGFVIGLDTDHPEFDRTKGKWPVRKVRYSQDRPSVVPKKSGPKAAEVYFTKSIDWEYEREWRIVRPLEEATERNTGIYCCPLPLPVVRELIVGFRMAGPERERLLGALTKSEHPYKVQIAVAGKNATSYRVDIATFCTLLSDEWRDP